MFLYIAGFYLWFMYIENAVLRNYVRDCIYIKQLQSIEDSSIPLPVDAASHYAMLCNNPNHEPKKPSGILH